MKTLKNELNLKGIKNWSLIFGGSDPDIKPTILLRFNDDRIESLLLNKEEIKKIKNSKEGEFQKEVEKIILNKLQKSELE
jgi:hypothetical protein